MKKILHFLLFTFLVLVSLNGQVNLYIEEQSVTLNNSVLTAWVFPIPGDLQPALNNLRDFSKERSKLKMKKSGSNILIAEEVFIPNISSKRGDFIGYAYATSTHNVMATVFQIGYDISLNTRDWSLEMGNLRNYTKEFMSYLYDRFYADSIALVNKELNSVQKELKKREKEFRKLEKKISGTHNKLINETDPVKLEKLKSDASLLQSDFDYVSDIIPELRLSTVQLKEEVGQLRNSSVQYQNAIGSL